MKKINKIELNIDIVNKYIDCITAFLPTKDQIDFINKYQESIMDDSYYNFLVNDTLEDIQLNEEFYKNAEVELEDIEIEYEDNLIGIFRIAKDKLNEIISNFDSPYSLSFSLNFAGTRGDEQVNQDTIYLEYSKDRKMVYLYAIEDNNYMLKLANDKNVLSPLYKEYDQQLNMNIYCFDVENISSDTEFTVFYR